MHSNSQRDNPMHWRKCIKVDDVGTGQHLSFRRGKFPIDHKCIQEYTNMVHFNLSVFCAPRNLTKMSAWHIFPYTPMQLAGAFAILQSHGREAWLASNSAMLSHWHATSFMIQAPRILVVKTTTTMSVYVPSMTQQCLWWSAMGFPSFIIITLILIFKLTSLMNNKMLCFVVQKYTWLFTLESTSFLLYFLLFLICTFLFCCSE